MKLNISLIFLLTIVGGVVSGQNKIQGYILDKQTNDPLTYATVGALGFQYGCYADTLGLFTLYYKNENDSLKISYLGYKDIYTTVHNIKNDTKIFLEPNPALLKEVVVTPSKHKPKVMRIGFFSKRYYGVRCTSYPLNLHATFIPFPKDGKIVFIKSIKFAYEIVSKNYPLRVKILKVNENGEPSDGILTENIVFGKYKPFKKHVADIDVSKNNIIMPANGVFVALEWIMDKPPVVIDNEVGEAGPYIGLVKTTNVTTHWIGSYNQSKWHVLESKSAFSIGLTVVNYDN